MRPLPERLPDIDRRKVVRVPQQPYLRVDRNDYSIDPRLRRPARRGPRLADPRDRRRCSTPASWRVGIVVCSPAG